MILPHRDVNFGSAITYESVFRSQSTGLIEKIQRFLAISSSLDSL
jgi:hypothetical protein